MNNGQFASKNELPADLQQIVERIRSQPVPPDSLNRSLARVALLSAAQQATAVQRSAVRANRASISRWTLWLGAPMAAALLLFTMLLPMSPTLAQSLLATKEQPWLFGKVTYEVDGSEHEYVFWFSAAKRVFALKLNESSVFVRFGESLQDNRVETFDLASGETMTREDVRLRQQDLHLLHTLLAIDPPSAFSESKEIDALRPGYDRYWVKLKDDNSRAEHVITVSRDSGLLHSWHVKQPDGMTAITQFEYLRTGPESIDALRKIKEPPAGTTKTHSPPLDVIPKQGVGEIRFGTSLAEVCAIIGEPTKEKAMGASAREMVYAELGLVLLVHSKHGVGDIQCCSNDARYSLTYGVTMKAFSGTNEEGIGIGSTREELIATYGEPTSNNQDGSIGYASQHIGYEFVDGRISRFGMRARSSDCVSVE